ncbi:OmpH/Skp family outer membrane protein [Flavitalea flava]
MKHISTILAVIALALAGVLFYMQSNQAGQLKKLSDNERKTSANGFKIGYFDMDTLEAHYDFFKEAQTQVKAKESAMNMELSSLDRSNQKKVEAWRQKGSAMTQGESEQAQQEYQTMQQTFQSRKTALEQELYKNTEDLKTNIRKKIEDYLKEYNKLKSYSFIFAYDPSSFIYNKDTLYNITPDLLQGLNAEYKKKN